MESVGVHRFSRPALSDLDRRMAAHLGPAPGVFLEIGANDGFTQSNTYYLERALGWSGILVEAVPSLYHRCRRLRRASRTVNTACVAPGAPSEVEVVDLDLMSVTLGQQDAADERARVSRGAGATITVPATTLSGVIDDCGHDHVDFMSVDVEGAEVSVLSGLDLTRHAPTWLLVETAHPEAVTKLLGGRMVLVEQMTHHDYLFHALPRQGDDQGHTPATSASNDS